MMGIASPLVEDSRMAPCRHQYYPSLGRRACLRYGGPDPCRQQTRSHRPGWTTMWPRALLAACLWMPWPSSPVLSHRWARRHPVRHLGAIRLPPPLELGWPDEAGTVTATLSIQTDKPHAVRGNPYLGPNPGGGIHAGAATVRPSRLRGARGGLCCERRHYATSQAWQQRLGRRLVCRDLCVAVARPRRHAPAAGAILCPAVGR